MGGIRQRDRVGSCPRPSRSEELFRCVRISRAVLYSCWGGGRGVGEIGNEIPEIPVPYGPIKCVLLSCSLGSEVDGFVHYGVDIRAMGPEEVRMSGYP